MKTSSFRLPGTRNSVYECSSSDEEEGFDTKAEEEVEKEHTGDADEETNDETRSNAKSNAGVTICGGNRHYKAKFRPTHTALRVVLEHIVAVMCAKKQEHVSTLCSNVLIETANRLNAFLSRAKVASLRNLHLSRVVAHKYGKCGKPACDDAIIDDLTGRLIDKRQLYYIELVYSDCGKRLLYFEKMKAMFTLISWIRVFTFDDHICASNISEDEMYLESNSVRHICFDFLQCIRQALYTLQISTGTIRKEQLFLSGDTCMDTLVYFTPLSDVRVHSGGFSKYPLLLYPVKPLTGKRKRGHCVKK